MIDLATQYYWHCQTSETWSTTVQGSNGQQYTVKWGTHGHKNPSVQRDYSCDCPSYRFGKTGTCKHIEQVKASGEHCNWMQFISGGEPTKTGKCPNCDSPVQSMGWGV